MLKTILSTLVGISAFFTSLMPNVLGVTVSSTTPYTFPSGFRCDSVTQCEAFCNDRELEYADIQTLGGTAPLDLQADINVCSDGFTSPTTVSENTTDPVPEPDWSSEFSGYCNDRSSCESFCHCRSGTSLGYKCDQYFSGITVFNFTCPTNHVCRVCSDACRDYSSDNNNCGSCGNVCASGQVCENASCVTPTTTVTLTERYIKPGIAELNPGKDIEFQMVAKFSDGKEIIEDDRNIRWNVTNTQAGTIGVDGRFKAGTVVGSYPDAIRGEVIGATVFPVRTASVRVIAATTATTTTTTTTTTTITTTDTATSPTVTKRELLPAFVRLKPGDKSEFRIKLTYSNGTTQILDDSLVDWKVIRGGGFINNATGVFTANQTVGLYKGTVRAEFNGNTLFANVEVYIPDTTSISTSDSTADSETTADTAVEPEIFVGEIAQDGSSPSPVPVIQPEKPVEMFGYLNERVDKCLQESFSSYVYTKFFSPNGEHANLADLSDSNRDKVRKCMEVKKVPELDSKVAACLELRLGKSRFEQVYQQGEALSSKEQKTVSGCFSQPNLVKVERKKPLDNVTKSCLEVQLGSDRYNQLLSGSVKPNADDLAKGRECMNYSSSVVNAPVVIESDEEDLSCLEAALGTDRYAAIYEKHAAPTQAEREAVAGCFAVTTTDENGGTVAAAQDVFLPVIPQQVVFIPEADAEDGMEIEQIAKDEQVAEGDSITLQGTALANTVVDLYIFSEPVVISTTTDENGNWSYELSYHLPEGEHNAYTVVRHPEKGLVRSGLFSFGVAYARGEANTPEVLIATAADTNKISLYLVMSGIVIFSGVGVLLFVFKDKLVKVAGTPDGVATETKAAEDTVPKVPPKSPPPSPPVPAA